MGYGPYGLKVSDRMEVTEHSTVLLNRGWRSSIVWKKKLALSVSKICSKPSPAPCGILTIHFSALQFPYWQNRDYYKKPINISVQSIQFSRSVVSDSL